MNAAPPRAVFETIRVRNGRAPLLTRHAARLAAACRALGLPLPGESLERLVAPWLGAGEVVVRVEAGVRGATVTTRPVSLLAPLAVIVATTRHVAYPFKVTERSAFVAAQSEARAAGADDALLLTASGLVAEGTVWSIFWWEGGRLATPPLVLGVLPGVGRARVLELVEPAVERERTPMELRGRSVFAINAVRGVVPIARLAGEPMPDHPRTARLAERFWPDGLTT
jgi:branched-subunit amino acid aminotransferase/4-amino-4-deoxychorismate lyase